MLISFEHNYVSRHLFRLLKLVRKENVITRIASAIRLSFAC